MRQLYTGFIHGRSSESQQRASRTAVGCSAYGPYSVVEVSEAQPDQSAMVEPGPVYSFRRARVGPSVQPALPDRLRSSPVPDTAVSPVGQPDTGAPGTRSCSRSRNDHGPARPGDRQWSRHSRCRSVPGGQVQPARLQDNRPLHLCTDQRRRSHGRHQL